MSMLPSFKWSGDGDENRAGRNLVLDLRILAQRLERARGGQRLPLLACHREVTAQSLDRIAHCLVERFARRDASRHVGKRYAVTAARLLVDRSVEVHPTTLLGLMPIASRYGRGHIPWRMAASVIAL